MRINSEKCNQKSSYLHSTTTTKSDYNMYNEFCFAGAVSVKIKIIQASNNTMLPATSNPQWWKWPPLTFSMKISFHCKGIFIFVRIEMENTKILVLWQLSIMKAIRSGNVEEIRFYQYGADPGKRLLFGYFWLSENFGSKWTFFWLNGKFWPEWKSEKCWLSWLHDWTALTAENKVSVRLNKDRPQPHPYLGSAGWI